MGLFRRRSPDAEPTDPEQAIAALLREALAEQGFETTVTGEPGDLRVVTDDGWTYVVHNLVAVLRDEHRLEWRRLTAEHVRRLLGMRSDTPVVELAAEDVRAGVRARILAVDPSMKPDTSYAIPFARGLEVVLCMDYPETVKTLSTSDVEELGIPLDELFRYGQANTNGEPIDESIDLSDGTRMLAGDSLFVASKAADMRYLVETVIGPAPRGVVFGIPTRHVLLYAVLGDDPITPVNALLPRIAWTALQNGPVPGGIVSPGLYYWRDGEVEWIGGPSADGEGFEIHADGRFGELLQGE